jgi:solute carrier family 35 protein F1/2
VGDLLVLAAATLYAGSNVGEEALVKQVDRVELLAMVGAYGLAWNTLQLLLLERRELSLMRWSWATLAPFGGFSVALFSFYSLVPFMLQVRPREVVLFFEY